MPPSVAAEAGGINVVRRGGATITFGHAVLARTLEFARLTGTQALACRKISGGI